MKKFIHKLNFFSIINVLFTHTSSNCLPGSCSIRYWGTSPSPSRPFSVTLTLTCYMAETASKQDESNPPLWLVPELARWSSSCPPLGFSRVAPARKNIFLLRPRQQKRKKVIGQYPTILTSRLVNSGAPWARKWSNLKPILGALSLLVCGL